MKRDSEFEIPDELPVLPLREFVVFPYMVLPLFLSRESSIAAVEDALAGDRLLVLVAQRNPELEEPGADDLHRVGTVAMVMRTLRLPDGRVKVLLQGLSKARDRVLRRERARALGVRVSAGSGLGARLVRRDRGRDAQRAHPGRGAASAQEPAARGALDHGQRARARAARGPGRLEPAAAPRRGPGDPRDRRPPGPAAPGRRPAVAASSRSRRSRRRSSRRPRRRCPGASASTSCASSSAPSRASSARWTRASRRSPSTATRSRRPAFPPEAHEEALRQLRRFERMHPDGPEAQVVRTYLEWMIELPWARESPDRLDLARARQILDEDHAHLAGIKDRILEFLGVRKLRHDSRGPDPLLRRAARRRQDLARPLDRARHGARVRARLARRHARRGGDPRPPAHLRRRAARAHPPGHEAGGHAQSGLHARRARQDRRATSAAIPRRRCSRCSTPSRTRASATTT